MLLVYFPIYKHPACFCYLENTHKILSKLYIVREREVMESYLYEVYIYKVRRSTTGMPKAKMHNDGSIKEHDGLGK